MASQVKGMHVKKVHVLTYRTLEILPKLAGIPVHLQHFLRVVASYAVVAFNREKALCRKTLSLVWLRP